MHSRGRNVIALGLAIILIAATAWALSFKPEPPADFTFVNNTEIQSLDPSLALGQPEYRVIIGLFEGLTNWDPKDLHPIPGVADRWDVSDDGRQYTFHIRDSAKWSDGSPIKAEDFVWQWRRMLDPGTISEYTYQLWYLENGERYSSAKVDPGDPVEVELHERADGALPFSRGKVLHGRLLAAIDQPATNGTDGAAENALYLVDIGGTPHLFQRVKGRDRAKWSPPQLAEAQIESLKSGAGGAKPLAELKVEPCKIVLLDFNEVGAKAIDDHTLQVKLKSATPYILQLTSYYPWFATNPKCVETFGYPGWTKPGNIVGNGPFNLQSHVVRNRLRLVKNPLYWNAANVHLNTIDVLPIEASSAAFNMYLNGQVDWIPLVPVTSVPELIARKRGDFHPQAEFTTDFYRFNCTKPPLDNKLVRQALVLAVDRKQIVEGVLRGGELPARSCVPPGHPDYQQALCDDFNPQRARQLLAEAGYPDGRGMPKFDIVYNTDELNQSIAEFIQSQWKENLGIEVGLQNMEWNSFLEAQRTMRYQISRAGWIGDYFDPNTFLDMWITDGGNNETGWSNKEYDKLIAQAAAERDTAKRMQILHQAETILMDELPILPIYFRVSRNIARPYVKGWYPNLLDLHPLDSIWIDQDEKQRFLRDGGRG
jgi:oligopeptide transport system substrate-binding protein